MNLEMLEIPAWVFAIAMLVFSFLCNPPVSLNMALCEK
jgi:hypothetical protein